jgi:LacI family transcriptional regulator
MEERIRAGQYRAGQKLPSERAIADEFSVSRLVVRAAIRELEIDGHLLRSSRCRPVVKGSNGSRFASISSRHTLGLWLWLNASEHEGLAFFDAVQRSLNHETYRLVMGHITGDTMDSKIRSEAQFLEQLARDNDIAGIILWYLGGETNLAALRKVRNAGIPMVFVDRRPPAGFDGDHVGVDNEGSAECVVNHLISLGHRNIAHITNNDKASTVGERLEGYRRALGSAGIPYRPELVVKYSDTGYAAVVRSLMAQPNPPSAVFAVNDLAALQLIELLREMGYRVPQDVAVAGFDGTNNWGPEKPFLTTAVQPFDRIGAQAVRLLTKRLETGPLSPYRHVLLDAPLAIGPSTSVSPREAICTPQDLEFLK